MPRLYDNVRLGADAIVDETALVGMQPADAAFADRPTIIGAGAVIRAYTVIYAGVTIGARLVTGHGALIREDNELGDDVSVGTNAVLEFGNRIGSRVSIHSGCFLERVTIEDDVFIGPNAVFTDDPHPACPRYADCVGGVSVRGHASIGANVTLLPGIEIGAGALVGAGSVVTQSVAAGSVVAGNPAREVKRVEELVCWPGHFSRPYAWRER
jgi:acetyltransferase-like isoleucine patch superfamily enzyme